MVRLPADGNGPTDRGCGEENCNCERRAAEAEKILAEFRDLEREDHYASGYAIAVIYAGLGDRERVLTYLERADNERSHWLVWLKRDPRWNDLRGDPRFQDLVRRVGLVP